MNDFVYEIRNIILKHRVKLIVLIFVILIVGIIFDPNGVIKGLGESGFLVFIISLKKLIKRKSERQNG